MAMRVVIVGAGGTLAAALAGVLADDGHAVSELGSWSEGGAWPEGAVAVVADGGAGALVRDLTRCAWRVVVCGAVPRRSLAWWSAGGGTGVTVARLPWMYGPGDPERRLYPLWRRMRDGRPAIVLSRAQAGARLRRGYIANVARRLAWAATAPRAAGRFYDLADPGDYTELEWVQQVAGALGWRGRIVVTAGPESALAQAAPPAEALRAAEAVPLAAGIRETAVWEAAQPAMSVNYAAEDASLRRLGIWGPPRMPVAGYQRAKATNSNAITSSTQRLPSGPTEPPVIQREP